MAKQNLTRASNELYRRQPDEQFESMQSLYDHCQELRASSQDHWLAPGLVKTELVGGDVVLTLGIDGSFQMNDWSFSQLCRLAGVAKDTVNKVAPETACRIFEDTLPRSTPGSKPFQFLTKNETLRSVHGTQYTRLWNAELLNVVREFATDFEPPQKGMNGGTGLYAGEADMFVFLIDPAGWAEVEGEAFAPGFFLWNSEVGCRSVGIQTFWFQAVCQNHIVWDAIDVTEVTRKHTAGVRDCLADIRRMIEALVEKRDARKDGFTSVVAKAMREKLGDDADEVIKNLTKHGITRQQAKDAVSLAAQQGRYTIWTLVDALTRLNGRQSNAGDRTDADRQASKLLELVAI